jgi:hypothetical protein
MDQGYASPTRFAVMRCHRPGDDHEDEDQRHHREEIRERNFGFPFTYRLSAESCLTFIVSAPVVDVQSRMSW